MNQSEVLRARIDKVNAYREVFIEDGQVKPAARAFFRYLAEYCKVSDSVALRDENGVIDPVSHVYRDGMRSVFDHINSVLSEDVAILIAKLKETESVN